MTRAQKPLTPLHPPKRIRVSDLTFRLARGQIHSTTAAWLILPDRSLPKPKLSREAFPKPPKAAGNEIQQTRQKSVDFSYHILPEFFFFFFSSRVLILTDDLLDCNYLDGSLIYEKIVLPQRELDRIKRRPDDSPSDGNLLLSFHS